MQRLMKLKVDANIYQLITASQKHRQLWIGALNQNDISPEATPEEMIGSITAGKGTITFCSEDLPPKGTACNYTLCLSTLCLRSSLGG